MAGPIARSLSVALSSLVVLISAACGNGTLAPHSRAPATLVAPTSLGTAQNFSVLAGTTVTNTGPSTLSRSLGVSPGSAVTGFPPGQVLAPGAEHAGDATAAHAQSDLTDAYLTLAGQSCTSNPAVELSGLTLKSGVYCFSSEAQLSGTLILDAEGDSAAAFVFLIGSKLTTAPGARVELRNGALPCNVFWQVGSSATIGTTTAFVGNILALTSISLQTGASLAGRALARNGAVTLDSNKIASDCALVSGGDGGTPGGDGGTPAGDGGTPGGDGGTPAGDGGTPGGVASLSCCEPTKLCGSTCANLQTDANNCGSCGKRCSASEVCSAGACAPCGAQSQCKDQCADLRSDPFNCGACGNACAPSQSCLAGSCGRCDGTLCSNTCVELSTDNANCGACGNVCAADQCCNAGSCTGGARNPSMRNARLTSCKQQ